MRRLSVSNLNAQRFKFMPFLGEWKRILGDQERTGCWLIYGKEKNGKSTFALNLANDLSRIEPVLWAGSAGVPVVGVPLMTTSWQVSTPLVVFFE